MPVNITGYNDRIQRVIDTVLSPTYFRTQGKGVRRGRSTLTEQVASGSGEVALGVLVSGPSNGYGPAVWRAITVNPDGTWTATGEEVPVIVSLLK